jgi:hypothetical protein
VGGGGVEWVAGAWSGEGGRGVGGGGMEWVAGAWSGEGERWAVGPRSVKEGSRQAPPIFERARRLTVYCKPAVCSST